MMGGFLLLQIAKERDLLFGGEFLLGGHRRNGLDREAESLSWAEEVVIRQVGVGFCTERRHAGSVRARHPV